MPHESIRSHIAANPRVSGMNSPLRDPLRGHWDTDRDSYLEPPPRGLR